MIAIIIWFVAGMVVSAGLLVSLKRTVDRVLQERRAGIGLVGSALRMVVVVVLTVLALREGPEQGLAFLGGFLLVRFAVVTIARFRRGPVEC